MERWQMVKGDTDLEVCAPVPQKRKTQKGKTRREKILCMETMERWETEGEGKKEEVGYKGGKKRQMERKSRS